MLFLICSFQIWIQHFLSLNNFVYRLNFMPKAVPVFLFCIFINLNVRKCFISEQTQFSFKYRKRC
jgi:hypothetical protein